MLEALQPDEEPNGDVDLSTTTAVPYEMDRPQFVLEDEAPTGVIRRDMAEEPQSSHRESTDARSDRKALEV